VSHTFFNTTDYAVLPPEKKAIIKRIIDKYGSIFWGEEYDTIEELEKDLNGYRIVTAWEEFGVTLVQVAGDMHTELAIVNSRMTTDQIDRYQLQD